MLVAFITFTGLHPEGSWPATAASMAEALERQGHDVVRLSPAPIRNAFKWKLLKLFHWLRGRQFQVERQEPVARELAASVNAQLAGLSPDLVLCSSSLPVPFLDAEAPVAFWTDATFAGMIGFYPEFSRLTKGTVRSGMALEALALQRADLAFYASDWAARSAIADHGADPAKVHVVPFGPNLSKAPERTEVMEAIARRSRRVCRLLFIGYDWERKQGPLVVATQRALEQRGIPTELTIIGGDHELDMEHRRIKVLGKLEKSIPSDLATLDKAFGEAHFLVVPSLAECYGMVYAEASAHGIPSMACETGGVGTVVRNGRNGQLFPPGVGPEALADFIAPIWSDPGHYTRLARATRDEFDDRLNWRTAIGSLMGIVEERAGVRHVV
jgi:glycosyltransferase involved in cell wall biosynthesis